MAERKQDEFDAAAFLNKAGAGRRIVQLKPKEAFFSQGMVPEGGLVYVGAGRRLNATENLQNRMIGSQPSCDISFSMESFPPQGEPLPSVGTPSRRTTGFCVSRCLTRDAASARRTGKLSLTV
jgi:hypothetical protein